MITCHIITTISHQLQILHSGILFIMASVGVHFHGKKSSERKKKTFLMRFFLKNRIKILSKNKNSFPPKNKTQKPGCSNGCAECLLYAKCIILHFLKRIETLRILHIVQFYPYYKLSYIHNDLLFCTAAIPVS